MIWDNKPEPCLGQIWTYVTHESDNISYYDETIKLIAKNLSGAFEYETLLGRRSLNTAYSKNSIINDRWVHDPEAKGSQFWREQR